jgi:hypothetical protein
MDLKQWEELRFGSYYPDEPSEDADKLRTPCFALSAYRFELLGSPGEASVFLALREIESLHGEWPKYKRIGLGWAGWTYLRPQILSKELKNRPSRLYKE